MNTLTIKKGIYTVTFNEDFTVAIEFEGKEVNWTYAVMSESSQAISFKIANFDIKGMNIERASDWKAVTEFSKKSIKAIPKDKFTNKYANESEYSLIQKLNLN